MAALVPGQLRRALELELADAAGVRPLARVDALVQLGLAQGEERLLAVLAGEGPLPRVDQVVPGERVRLGEALPAVGAGEGTGAAVGDDVLLLGFLAFEPFVALGTGVGLVVHVRAVVLRELPLRQEALPALGAEERLLPGVHPLVSRQHRHQGEPLGAMGALERPLSGVNAEVFHEHEAQREALAALVALVRPLPRVAGQVPLHVGPAGERFIAMRALELRLHLVQLPVQRARQQGVEALVALVADVLLAGDVGPLVLRQVGGRREALAADGADVRKLALLRVRRLVVDGQRAQVGEGAAAEAAGEGDGGALVFALMLGQVPRVLEGALAQRAVEGPLSRVGELVPPDVRGPGERLAARLAGQSLVPARGLGRAAFAVALRRLRLVLLCFVVFHVSHGEKFDRGEDFVRAGGSGSERLPRSRQTHVLLGVDGLHVEVRGATCVHLMEGALRAGEDNGRHLICIVCKRLKHTNE